MNPEQQDLYQKRRSAFDAYLKTPWPTESHSAEALAMLKGLLPFWPVDTVHADDLARTLDSIDKAPTFKVADEALTLAINAFGSLSASRLLAAYKEMQPLIREAMAWQALPQAWHVFLDNQEKMKTALAQWESDAGFNSNLSALKTVIESARFETETPLSENFIQLKSSIKGAADFATIKLLLNDFKRKNAYTLYKNPEIQLIETHIEPLLESAQKTLCSFRLQCFEQTRASLESSLESNWKNDLDSKNCLSALKKNVNSMVLSDGSIPSNGFVDFQKAFSLSTTFADMQTLVGNFCRENSASAEAGLLKTHIVPTLEKACQKLTELAIYLKEHEDADILDRLSEKESLVEKMTRDIKTLEAKIGVLESKIEEQSAQDEKRTKDAIALIEKNRDINEELRRKSDELNSAKIDFLEAKEEISDLQAEISGVQAEKSKASETIKALQKDFAKKAKSLTKVLGRVKASDKKVDALEKKNDQLTDEIASLTKDSSLLRTQLEQKTSEVARIEKAYSSTVLQCKKLSAELNKTQETLSEAQLETRRAVRNAQAPLRDTIAKLEKTNAQLASRAAKLTQDLQASKQETGNLRELLAKQTISQTQIASQTRGFTPGLQASSLSSQRMSAAESTSPSSTLKFAKKRA